MAITLPKEAFLALAALGWADGSMRKDERIGLARAAKECGLEGDDLAVVDRALAKETSLAEFVPGDMTEWERLLTYALAVWLTRLDGVQSTDERTSLADLAKRLDLAKPICERASAAALEVAVLPAGGRPETFDFVKLAARLREKLPQYAK
jgi:uncharacterized membrane protein YebE (DUF533 family)